MIGAGSDLGLTLVLNGDVNEYYCSSTNSYGFKVLFHSPNEQPKISRYGQMIANGFESHFVLTPLISEASNSIREIPKSIRQCLFENENSLSLFR